MDRPGVFLLDKPSGITSARAIAILKKRLAIDRVGHAGTLDPMATGLLVVLVGAATRLARFAEAHTKHYSGRILFGKESDTHDVTGEMRSTGAEPPDREAVISAGRQFIGQIEQVPPVVSALKVDGQRAYRLHRLGEEFTLTARQVHVERFDCAPVSESEYTFDVVCSKGTYIRSLARDLGDALHCGGVLSQLRREASGHFNVLHAYSPELAEWSHMLDWSRIFDQSQRIDVSPEVQARLYHGDVRPLANAAAPGGNCLFFTQDGTGGTILQHAAHGWTLLANIGQPEDGGKEGKT